MADERKKSLGYCECILPLYKDILIDVLDALDADISKHGHSSILPRQDKIALEDLSDLYFSIKGTPACDVGFLAKKLEKEIEGEKSASEAYSRLADLADMIGETTLGETLRSVARNERWLPRTLLGPSVGSD